MITPVVKPHRIGEGDLMKIIHPLMQGAAYNVDGDLFIVLPGVGFNALDLPEVWDDPTAIEVGKVLSQMEGPKKNG